MSGVSGVRGVLTSALREHKPTTKRVAHPSRQGILLNIPACKGCDWAEEDGDHDAHVADVLVSLPGVAVVQLPEPNSENPDEWIDLALGDERVEVVDDEVGLTAFARYYSAGEARVIALALLAAAERLGVEGA